jgi:hypothetical protein
MGSLCSFTLGEHATAPVRNASPYLFGETAAFGSYSSPLG